MIDSAVRVSHWQQMFYPAGVPDIVFEAIAGLPSWSYDYAQFLSSSDDDDSPQKLVVIAFGACGSAAREEMLLVQPINRQDARRILVQYCGYNGEFIDHILLSTQLYRLSQGGLALCWVDCLDQTHSQLTVDLTGDASSPHTFPAR